MPTSTHSATIVSSLSTFAGLAKCRDFDLRRQNVDSRSLKMEGGFEVAYSCFNNLTGTAYRPTANSLWQPRCISAYGTCADDDETESNFGCPVDRFGYRSSRYLLQSLSQQFPFRRFPHHHRKPCHPQSGERAAVFHRRADLQHSAFALL